MPQVCECNVVGSFPYLQDMGFISISLRTNTPVIVTSDGLALLGATAGELSVSAYGSMYNPTGNPLTNNTFQCPGRAGANYNWLQKHNCVAEQTHYIPNGGAKSFIEGDIGVGVTEHISIDPVAAYQSIQVSASSGPATVYLRAEHTDGHNFQYIGGPIQVYDRVINVVRADGTFMDNVDSDGNRYNYYGALIDVLPDNSELFLMSFSWDQTPPNIATVSYSFAFTGGGYTLLSAPISNVVCPGTNTTGSMSV